MNFFKVIGLFLNLNRTVKRLIVISVDGLLCSLAAIIAFSLRFGVLYNLSPMLAFYLAVAILCWFPIFYTIGVYRSIFRFAGRRTLLALIRAATIMAIVLMVVFTFVGIPGVPRTIPMIHWLVFVMLLCLSRIVSRYLLVDILARGRAEGAAIRMLIYGAGDTGRHLAGSIPFQPGVFFCGFIDDDPRLAGQRLDGYPVFGHKDLEDVIARQDVTNVILALPHTTRAMRKRIVDELQRHKVHVQTLPDMKQIIDGRVTVSDLREVQIDDLLGRDPVPPLASLLDEVVNGKTVLITGAGGSIGSELCRQLLLLRPRALVLVDFSEFALYAIERELREEAATIAQPVQITVFLCNVADRLAIGRVFATVKPNVVFHAAAYKHVPMVEANPLAGIGNNVLGTMAVADAADEADCERFILVSTDKAVRPTNVMGASKRMAELVVQAKAAAMSGTLFSLVRFGNVLGSSGSVVPLFRSQIGRGGPITVTHRDVTRYFMTIPEAAQLVIQAGAMSTGGEVFVLDMGDVVKIIDLARAMIRLSGLTVCDEETPDGDICILETGLRPGEKLYEELLIGNDPQPTRHERIMQARESFVDWNELRPRLEELSNAIHDGRLDAAMECVFALVPEYVPDHAWQLRLGKAPVRSDAALNLFSSGSAK